MTFAITFKGKSNTCMICLALMFFQFSAFSQVCNCPPINQCAPCQAGLVSLTLRYNGIVGAWVMAYDGDGLLESKLIGPGGIFTVTGSNHDGKFDDNDLSVAVNFFSNFAINTNCGTPVQVNSTLGSFTVMAGQSKAGGALCCAPADRETIPPDISNCSADILVSLGPAECSKAVNWNPPTTADNCGGVNLTSNYDPGDTFFLGTTIVTYTATDGSGNMSNCSFNVTVKDVTAPELTSCSSNRTVPANSSCTAVVTWPLPTVSNNCGTYTLSSNYPSGTSFPLGTTQVTYTAADGSGNTSNCSFNVTVNDVTAPEFTSCPSNRTVPANSSCTAVVTWPLPTVSNNCGTYTLSSAYSSGSTFPLGTTEVIYTARDAVGNTSTCSFTITVKDTNGPVIAGYADVLVDEGLSCQTKVTWPLPSTTDCGAVKLVSSHNSGDLFPVGTTDVTYTATDNAGNSSTSKFKVIVKDKAAPIFQNCNQEIVVAAHATCASVVTWTPPSITDNCGTVTVKSSHDPGSTFPIGKTTVKYTATDVNGNVSVCQFNVVVKNESLPIISNCPKDVAIKANEAGVANVQWTIPTAEASCGEIALKSSHQPGALFNVGTTKVEYKATDDVGNTSYCYFNVVVSPVEIEIDVAKIITPDGDGINDDWILSNIEKFKDNKVVIVDRWGSVVFSGSGYNNASVAWRGTNTAGAVAPTGTYFYSLSVRFGSSKIEKSGFIELIR